MVQQESLISLLTKAFAWTNSLPCTVHTNMHRRMQYMQNHPVLKCARDCVAYCEISFFNFANQIHEMHACNDVYICIDQGIK